VHARELRRTEREWKLFLAAAAVFCIAAVVMTVLYATKGSTEFAPEFERTPADPSEVLDCAGVPNTYWARLGGAPTQQCIFSGDVRLGDGRFVTEEQVVALCNSRLDCGGYVVQTAQTREPCYLANATPGAQPGDTMSGCIRRPYNNGAPQFTLFSARGAANLVQVSPLVQGAHNEVRTTTYVKQA
jgi:hypothetical protein